MGSHGALHFFFFYIGLVGDGFVLSIDRENGLGVYIAGEAVAWWVVIVILWGFEMYLTRTVPYFRSVNRRHNSRENI